MTEKSRLRRLAPLAPRINSSILGKNLKAATKEERRRERDARRRLEQPWREWYALPIWKDPDEGLRARQLTQQPICETCHLAAATVAHHKIPHQGNWQLFIDPNNLESACKSCHDGAIQRGERAGNFVAEINLGDDETLPVNVAFPPTLGRSAIPLTIITGPPGAGKSTWVAERKGDLDVVIDVDAIVAELSGTHARRPDIKHQFLLSALLERNRRLQLLAKATAPHAWFIVGAPNGGLRQRWARTLGASEVIVIETPLEVCIGRIKADPLRAQLAHELIRAVDLWWATYTACPLDTVWRGG